MLHTFKLHISEDFPCFPIFSVIEITFENGSGTYMIYDYDEDEEGEFVWLREYDKSIYECFEKEN